MKKMLFLTVLSSLLYGHLTGQSFQSKHFTIQKLAEGVYAAIADKNGYAVCNAGIIDLGNETLAFDVFMVPEAAADLKKAAFLLTGRPVKYVVNSHFHNDHVGGNQVFDDADIISTVRTRELIEKFQPGEIEGYKNHAPGVLEKLNMVDTAGLTPHQREEHRMMLKYFEAQVAAKDTIRTILPGITFENMITLNGTKRSVQLICYGAGHTESDLFLYIPGERIAFLGDLLFIQNHPWLGDGNPDDWISCLDSIGRLDLLTVIPGHGPVGTPADMNLLKNYIRTVSAEAKSCIRIGVSPEQCPSLIAPHPFDNWFLSDFYKPNVIFEYNRLLKQGR